MRIHGHIQHIIKSTMKSAYTKVQLSINLFRSFGHFPGLDTELSRQSMICLEVYGLLPKVLFVSLVFGIELATENGKSWTLK